MGCVPKSLELLKSYVHLVGGFSGRKMLELGNQQMYCHPDIPEASAAKLYFQSQGVDHTSIDLNGLLGALPLDLSKPIDKPEWNEAFDIVTDFGTSEHVGNTIEALYNCRRSCHTFCRPGGLLVFMNPKTGNWPGHGYHYFTQEHYRRLVDEAGYTVLEFRNIRPWAIQQTAGRFMPRCCAGALLFRILLRSSRFILGRFFRNDPCLFSLNTGDL